MPEKPLPDAISYPTGTLSAGIHSGLSPFLLNAQQCAFAVNTTFRGGYAGTRPPIRKLATVYASTEYFDVREELKAIYQGGGFYQSLGANASCLLTSVGGRLFRWAINGETATVSDVTPATLDGFGAPVQDRNDPTRPQVWMAQGQDFMVVQDGQANPWFFDGSGTRRSGGEAKQELPPGKMVHYSNGRFIVVLSEEKFKGVAYIASDLVYNTSSGTAAYNYRDSILKTNDNKEVLAGLAFGVPLTSGPITALFTTAVSDTSLGQGPLQVATLGGIYSVNLPLDATLWTTTQQPTQVVALPNAGVAGGYAVTTVNGDAWYRGVDGVRSFSIARRDFNTWVQTPLSFEMQRILPFDQPGLLNFASVVSFNNRALCTCSPYATEGRGVAHRGLAVIDFNNISSLTVRSQPCWEGLWTGLPILQVITGVVNSVPRCFIFAVDEQNEICLYELGVDEGGWFDWDGEQDVAIASYIETAALFGRESDPMAMKQPLKKLITADFWWEQLFGPASVTPSGKVAFSVSYRSDQYPFWVSWKDWSLCAPACYSPATCSQPVQVQQQYATYKRLPEPGDGCNTLTGRPMRQGYSFQVKIEWTGHAVLHLMNTWATQFPATRNVVCDAGECNVLSGCLDNPFTYIIEPGPGTDGLLEWDVSSNSPTINTPTGDTITAQ